MQFYLINCAAKHYFPHHSLQLLRVFSHTASLFSLPPFMHLSFPLSVHLGSVSGELFSSQGYSASVATLARRVGGRCHRPRCRLRCAVRHGSAEPVQLAAPTETQRLLSCPSRGVRADMLAEPSKHSSSLTQQEVGTH